MEREFFGVIGVRRQEWSVMGDETRRRGVRPNVIRLTPTDAVRYTRLRLRMLTGAPWAFSASPENDQALNPEWVSTLLADTQNVIVAMEDVDLHRPDAPDLVAAAAIRRMKGPKFAHRARMWGVYVEPSHRGQGYGRAVVAAAIDVARDWPGVDYIDLGVSERAREAISLYESVGFLQWGREPATTQYEDRRYDEIYMALTLLRAC